MSESIDELSSGMNEIREQFELISGEIERIREIGSEVKEELRHQNYYLDIVSRVSAVVLYLLPIMLILVSLILWRIWD
jgi:hypothetical protein